MCCCVCEPSTLGKMLMFTVLKVLLVIVLWMCGVLILGFLASVNKRR